MKKFNELLFEKFKINKNVDTYTEFKSGDNVYYIILKNINDAKNSNPDTFDFKFIDFHYDTIREFVEDVQETNQLKCTSWRGNKTINYKLTPKKLYQSGPYEKDTTKSKKAISYKHIKWIAIYMNLDTLENLVEYCKNHKLTLKYLYDEGYLSKDEKWILDCKINNCFDEKELNYITSEIKKTREEIEEKNKRLEKIKNSKIENKEKAKKFIEDNKDIDIKDLLSIIYYDMEEHPPHYNKDDYDTICNEFISLINKYKNMINKHKKEIQ